MTDLSGKHLIDGVWLGEGARFHADNPATGASNEPGFFNASPAHVRQAVAAAQRAFAEFAAAPLTARARFLRAIAANIDARGEALTRVAGAETALPAARLEGERGRTVGQLRFFADWIEEGSWLEPRIDHGDPDRAPAPKPDLRSANRALGPVAVFGASNFPLAFSTAGGDTASALAAGCPVIVKAHPAHPGTSELVAQAIDDAMTACDMPSGVFAMLQGGDFTVGQALVADPGVKAVGFTGSLAGGRALFDIAVSRPEPIPFYGELGSNNPVFLLPAAMAARAVGIAEAWVQSLTMGVGQFCTNPGVVVMLGGAPADAFRDAALKALATVAPQAMLTCRIADAYHAQTARHEGDDDIACLLAPRPDAQSFHAAPGIFQVSARTWLDRPDLSEEIFGPSAIMVECDDIEQMRAVAASLCGQLTATVQMDPADSETAAPLLALLADKAGRVLANGFPTGVEVCHAMVHGGPYPASTDAGTTSVGTLAIRRFLRPVAYQGLPDALLPPALQEANPLGLLRLVDGRWQTGGA